MVAAVRCAWCPRDDASVSEEYASAACPEHRALSVDLASTVRRRWPFRATTSDAHNSDVYFAAIDDGDASGWVLW